MRHLRRVIHVLAWMGALAIAIVSLALIISQTPWFRDYLRRIVVREAKQYLDGELTIGRLGGNLFFGVTLSDVAVDVSGDRVVAIKGLEVDYSVFHLVSRGIVLDRIVLTSPSLTVVRDARGWNLGRLVKKQRQEADRRGPGRPITLPSIAITGGTVAIDDRVGSTTYRIPRRIDGLDVQASFEYEPVHYSVKLGRLSFRGADPEFVVQQLTGNFAVRDDNFYLEAMALRTPETALSFDGVLEQYLRRPVIKVSTEGRASLPEIGRILLAVAGYDLHPDLRVRTDGAIDALAMDLDVKSEAGLVRGQVTADFQTPDLRFTGPVHVERLNLGPIFKNPRQRTDITGDTTFDIALRSAPAGAPALDRLRGTFAFRGPHAGAFGYDAAGVDVAGSVEGPRILLARARANAYGAAATARGSIVLPQGKRVVAYDLQGTADGVNMRRLPAFLRAPKLATEIALSAYHVQGSGSSASGTATMKPSRVEGASIADGTLVGFDVARGRFAYTARGAATDLDLPRLGRVLDVKALDDPLYAGRVNGAFDVKGSGTSLDTLSLDASGTLRNTTVGGTSLPEMTFATRIDDKALTLQTKGGFEHLNPAVLTRRKPLDGNVSGIVDATVRIPDLSVPFTTSAFAVEGAVTLAPSLVGGVQIAGANIVGKYENDVADLTRLQIKGPDVMLDATGRLALDRVSQSKLTYHVDAGNLAEVGRIAGQTVEGSALVDGTITGNAADLRTAGTLSGIGLAWNGQRLLGTRSTFSVAVPELDFVNARVEATTGAEFVQVAGIELNRVTAKTVYAKKRLEFTANFRERTREVETAGNVIFHPEHQEIHLPQFAVKTDGIEWRMAPGGDPAIQYRSGDIDVKNVTLTSGDQSIAVSGTLSAGRASQPAAGKLSVQARNVDLAQAERLLLQNRGLGGRLTADAVIAGTTSQPIVDGHVEVTGGKFQNYAYESLVADVDYGERKITLDATLRQAPGVSITAKGVVPMSVFSRAGAGAHVAASADDAFDVRIHTPALNLGVVQGFTTAITNVAGTLQADVRITGAGRDPHFGGFIEIRDGAFAVPRTGTSYSGLDTRIDLEPEAVRIRRFEILDENGEQLAVAGRLAVHASQIGDVDVTLESQNFEAIDNNLGDVGIGTRLKITGQLTRPKLVGELRIATGRLEVDRILQLFYDPYRTDVLPQVVSAERAAQAAGSAEEATRQALGQAAQGGKPATQPEPLFDEDFWMPPRRATFFDNVALDVRVRIPDNLVVRGRKLRPGGPTRATIGDINVTVGGDLTVRKNYDEPVTIAGTVNTVRGTYQFQGRQFEIARDGTLRFTGEPTNPIVDVTAVRRIPETGVEARVRISGNLSPLPELQLSSIPPLEESDVLALIVFNRPINELGTGERASLAATAGGIAGGFIATPLGESIGRALDLDLFEITTSAEGDSVGAGVTVGKQIGDKTFFKLRQQFGERTYSEFLVEYQIADFLRLAATAAPETSGAANRIGQRRLERAGIDLIFFFSY